MSIRRYQATDRDDVRRVCVGTAGNVNTDKAKGILWNLFCDYYIDEEPDCCFVYADNDNVAQGYIIASADYKQYEETYRKSYLKNLRKLKFTDSIVKALDLWYCRRYARVYPAHLHIDIMPEYQRMGLGHKLMNALTIALAEKGVKGVYLIVGKNNLKGVNFYKKYGFIQIGKVLGSIVFGLDTLKKADELRASKLIEEVTI